MKLLERKEGATRFVTQVEELKKSSKHKRVFGLAIRERKLIERDGYTMDYGITKELKKVIFAKPTSSYLEIEYQKQQLISHLN